MGNKVFYAVVFRDILRQSYPGLTDDDALDLWRRLIAEEPLPTEEASAATWSRWGQGMTAWCERLELEAS
jgi:hypothetical protein